MKISEIKALIENGTEIHEIFNEQIKVITYVPIYERQSAIQICAEACIEYDNNGYATIDATEKELNYVITVVTLFTDIEPEIKGDYDSIMESGLWRLLYIKLNEDSNMILYDMSDILDSTLENKINSVNSIEATVKNVGNKILGLVSTASDKMGSFDIPSLQKMFKSMIKDVKKSPELVENLKNIFDTKSMIDGVSK